jgi:hypothetical protein
MKEKKREEKIEMRKEKVGKEERKELSEVQRVEIQSESALMTGKNSPCL